MLKMDIPWTAIIISIFAIFAIIFILAYPSKPEDPTYFAKLGAYHECLHQYYNARDYCASKVELEFTK